MRSACLNEGDSGLSAKRKIGEFSSKQTLFIAGLLHLKHTRFRELTGRIVSENQSGTTLKRTLFPPKLLPARLLAAVFGSSSI